MILFCIHNVLLLYYIIAFCMGIAISMQVPINASLAKILGNSPINAALTSFVIGSICLLIIAYLQGSLNLFAFKTLSIQNLWKFLGGVLGAFFVFGTVLLASKIGLINMFLLVLVAQLLMSLILDSVGAFGLVAKPITLQKIAGLGVVILGLCIFFSQEIRSYWIFRDMKLS